MRIFFNKTALTLAESVVLALDTSSPVDAVGRGGRRALVQSREAPVLPLVLLTTL